MLWESVLDLSVRDLEFYTFKTFEINNEMVIVSRTGYTGEDGFEIYGSHAYIKEIWEKLINSKKVMPCGLGARDTLRFEVGLPLYGNELSKDISPYRGRAWNICKNRQRRLYRARCDIETKRKRSALQNRGIGT